MVKICMECNIYKDVCLFDKNRYTPDGYTTKCADCKNAHNKIDYYSNIKARKLKKDEWRKNHPNYFKEWHGRNSEYNKTYFKDNPEYHKIWARKARKNNIQRNLSERLRDRVRKVVVGTSKAVSAVSDLGCTLEEFKTYMKSKFQPRMSWENYGKRHIDHIRPLKLFDLSEREQFLKACNYTNLQPL